MATSLALYFLAAAPQPTEVHQSSQPRIFGLPRVHPLLGLGLQDLAPAPSPPDWLSSTQPLFPPGWGLRLGVLLLHTVCSLDIEIVCSIRQRFDGAFPLYAPVGS